MFLLKSGALAWVERLKWSGLGGYHGARKRPMRNPDTGEIEMYLKAYDNFKFFWIVGAGHAVSWSLTRVHVVNRISGRSQCD